MRKDVIFIAIMLAAAGILYLFLPRENAAETVIITKNGQFYRQVPLNADSTVDIEGDNTVVIKSGEVYMEYADCPDKLCINQGKITDSSKKIICLPNKVIVEVTKKSETDAVVR